MSWRDLPLMTIVSNDSSNSIDLRLVPSITGLSKYKKKK